MAKLGAMRQLLLVKRLVGLVVVVVAEAGRADDGMDAVLGEVAQVFAGRVDVREVDGHLGLGPQQRVGRRTHLDVERLDLGDLADVEPGVERIDRRDELEAVIAGNGLAHGDAHAATGAENAHANSFRCSHDCTLMDARRPHHRR